MLKWALVAFVVSAVVVYTLLSDGNCTYGMQDGIKYYSGSCSAYDLSVIGVK